MADVGWAVMMLKSGALVRRAGWRDGAYLLYVPGSRFVVNRPPMNRIYPEGSEVSYHGHVDMKTREGDVVPWSAGQKDLLADDWQEALHGDSPEAPEDDVDNR
jgi:Protein of unknown function (DUF2829)